ncbi:hypothetical protein, partial [Deinococcus frigens]|uniref:hypothetical protein n=1 Tax=Deinococcus frigens TaxID=249403 RepID=UPI001B802F88
PELQATPALRLPRVKLRQHNPTNLSQPVGAHLGQCSTLQLGHARLVDPSGGHRSGAHRFPALYFYVSSSS